MVKYGHVFVAGTFEGLHKGHQALLNQAFAEGRNITVGLTSDAFVKKFKIKNVKFKITRFDTRNSVLEHWLKAHHLARRATIIPIDDPCEPAASMGDLDALVLTKETRARGEEINRKRIARGLKRLALIVVPMVSAQDGDPISATRIRTGEIDRDGLPAQAGRLVMPESLRTLLSEPLGTVLTGKQITLSLQRNKEKTIITVGDVATKTLLDQKIMLTLAIIDFRVGRKPYTELTSYVNTLVLHSTRVESGPGYISVEARRAIQAMLVRLKSQEKLLHQPLNTKMDHVLIIDGEEDLLVLPVILSASLGSIVYYGQPRSASVRGKPHGLVEVVVTQKKKREVQTLLDSFT